MQKKLYYVGANPNKKIQKCKGNCDSNDECAGYLVFFHGKDDKDVPGCFQRVNADVAARDYCVY